MLRAPGIPGRFIGRASELSTLARACKRATNGQRQLVVVTGEPGIGKTALCQRAAERAARAGMRVVWGRCWPHGGAPPMWPWPAVLADLLGEQARDLLAGEREVPDVDPERFARFAAVADRIREACVETPSVLVLDDMHRADGGAVLLTRFLVRTMSHARILIVLATRGDAETPAVDTLHDELAADAIVVPLRRFDLGDTVGYLAAHGFGDVDSRLGRALLGITGGNPLFLARAVALGDPSPSGLSRVETAIGAAIERQSPSCRHLLTLLAVLGIAAPVRELATLAAVGPTTALDTLRTAQDAGLVWIEEGQVEFGHELVRQAALGRLTLAQRCAAHARAAGLLSGPSPPQLTRRARHALAAAERSESDAVTAIDACRVAARALTAGFDYEGAAGLLGHAAELAEPIGDVALRAAVQVEAAEATLACGKLADSRAAFDRAARAAEAAREHALEARAVLGLGGMWVNEHRDVLERSRVLTVQRQALRDLPESEHLLRCRLRVRLAAEDVYSGQSTAGALHALAQARATGDARVLAEALSLTHHALLAPKHAAMRLELADELIATASGAGEGVLALFGLLWRTVDLYQLGDPGAEQSLADLRMRADALRCRHVLFIVQALDVMRTIRRGELSGAELAAQRCYQAGLDVGDADATGYYAGQLLTIRWIQGRDGELLELIKEAAASPTLIAAEFALRAGIAMAAARAGRLDEARAALRRLSAGGLAALPTSSTWMTGLATVIEAAWLVGDGGTATEAARLLEPYGELPVMPSLAISCLGSAHRALALAALAGGEYEVAVTRMTAALEANLRLGNRPLAAVTRAELARTLVARDAPGDLGRAHDLLTEAHAEAVAMEVPVRAREWATSLASLASRLRPKACLLQRGGHWLLTADGHEVRLPDLVGLGYLATLIEHPGQELSALDLCMAGAIEGGRQSLLDTTAIQRYRARLAALDAELDAAGEVGDPARGDRLAHERQALVDQLAGALGLGGRLRTFHNSPERARTAVRKAITRAMRSILDADSELGAQLGRAVHTGATCRYEPAPAATHWKVARE